MSWLLSMLVIAGGLAMGLMWVAAGDPDAQLADINDVAVNGQAKVMAAAGASTAPVESRPLTPRSGRKSDTATRLVPPAPVEASRTIPLAPSPVARSDMRIGGADQGRSTTTTTMPRTALSRGELVSQIQRELKRVGCYAGEISGDWTQSSRRAMSQLMERVNATLPVDVPDDVQLALVKGQRGMVCGSGCPSGQVMVPDGRCLPSAVVARNSRAASPSPSPAGTASGWVVRTRREPDATVAAATPTPGVPLAPEQMPTVLPGRMGMGAPADQDEAAAELTEEGHDGRPPAVIIYRHPQNGPSYGWRPSPPPPRPSKSFNRMPAWAVAAFERSK